MSFRARYPGECGGCGAEFEEGDDIEYNSLGELVLSECCGRSIDFGDPLDFDPDDSFDIRREHP